MGVVVWTTKVVEEEGDVDEAVEEGEEAEGISTDHTLLLSCFR